MSSSYIPRITISSGLIVRRQRQLPIKGRVICKTGHQVEAEQVVLKAFIPGPVSVINLQSHLGIDPSTIAEKLRVSVGDDVRQGDLICRVTSLFGLIKSEFFSPITGTVEFFTKSNGHMGIRGKKRPISTKAFISGTVVEDNGTDSVTIESSAAVVQGIFGVGGESYGELMYLYGLDDKIITKEHLKLPRENISKRVVTGGRSFSIGALRYAAEKGVAGIVTGSMDIRVLNKYVNEKINVAVTGNEKVPFPLILTEGFGDRACSHKARLIFFDNNGSSTSISGATQIRAGAIRPEIIIPRRIVRTEQWDHDSHLSVGSEVRVTRAPWFGVTGIVKELPQAPQKIATGAKVRVVVISSTDSIPPKHTIITVPRANVELL